MNEHQEQMLRRLLSLVVSAAHPVDDDEPRIMIGHGSGGLLFQGEALSLLLALERELANPSLAVGGPHRVEVERLLYETCRRSRDDHEDAAVDWFGTTLESPPRAFVIGIPVSVHFSGADLDLGSAQLVRDFVIDGEPVRRGLDFENRQILVTKVSARDPDSAEVRARDLLDEAMSLLRLASDPPEHALGPHISASEGTTWTAMRAPDRLIVRRASEGQLLPPIKYIAEAMSRDTTVQSDWERRTIAASRWHNRAVSAGWPSASLAACFTALECLFVRDRNESRKGETIARRVAQHHAHVPHLPDDEVASWVAALYQRRNKTVHEGIPYGDEIDVERIEELTVAAIHWAAHHLDRNHRSGGTCQAFDEVHDATHE